MTFRQYCLAILSVFTLATPAAMASPLFMARVPQTFPETMLELQEAIRNHGYTVSRVQRVDIGLTKSGYKTDKYRVVFYGKPEEIKAIINSHPDMIAYLPLKIAIFAEESETLLVAINPQHLVTSSTQIRDNTLKRWQQDLESIFDQMRSHGGD